jgi:AmmeMemoRadiSam system protein B
MRPNVRNPAVAGAFYPGDPAEIEAMLARLFDRKSPSPNLPVPKALIAPHAGWSYSGAVAAAAFQTVEGRAFHTVVLLGNAHAARFDGIALDPHDAWRTPLGDVPLDEGMRSRLTALDPRLYRQSDEAHRRDHVLEVQLPFLQYILQPGFNILPLLFGQNPAGGYRQCTDDLLSVMSDADLLIASSDLSHYPSSADAESIDRATLQLIAKLDIAGLERHESAVMQRGVPELQTAFCGPDAVKTVLETGRRKGWRGEVLACRNSGDAEGGDRSSVVGYGALVFRES